MWATQLNLDLSSKCQLKTQLDDQSRSELKLTELFIKMFTDHQALMLLMKDKKLSIH